MFHRHFGRDLTHWWVLHRTMTTSFLLSPSLLRRIRLRLIDNNSDFARWSTTWAGSEGMTINCIVFTGMCLHQMSDVAANTTLGGFHSLCIKKRTYSCTKRPANWEPNNSYHYLDFTRIGHCVTRIVELCLLLRWWDEGKEGWKISWNLEDNQIADPVSLSHKLKNFSYINLFPPILRFIKPPLIHTLDFVGIFYKKSEMIARCVHVNRIKLFNNWVRIAIEISRSLSFSSGEN